MQMDFNVSQFPNRSAVTFQGLRPHEVAFVSYIYVYMDELFQKSNYKINCYSPRQIFFHLIWKVMITFQNEAVSMTFVSDKCGLQKVQPLK